MAFIFDNLYLKNVDLLMPSDLNPSNQNLLILTVYTGIRRNAGTTSNIVVKIIGLNDSSEPILLNTPSGNFEQSSVYSFLLTTKNKLSPRSIRVWHDQSGLSLEWYVDRFVLNTGQMIKSARYF